jgi:hypothetical protein
LYGLPKEERFSRSALEELPLPEQARAAINRIAVETFRDFSATTLQRIVAV